MIQLGGRGMRCGKIILLGAEVKRYNSILNKKKIVKNETALFTKLI